MLIALLFSSIFPHFAPPKAIKTEETDHYYVLNTQGVNLSAKELLLSKKAPDLNIKALQTALKAYHCAAKRGYVKKPYLTIIDSFICRPR